MNIFRIIHSMYRIAGIFREVKFLFFSFSQGPIIKIFYLTKKFLLLHAHGTNLIITNILSDENFYC